MGIYRPDCTITTNTVAEELILAEFYNMLEKGGSTVKIVPEIQRVKFIKNLWNVSFSAITTLVGYRLPAIFRAPPKIGEQYEPFVSDATKSYIEEYTIPNIRAILEEALTLGAYGFSQLLLYFTDEPQHVRLVSLTHPMAFRRLLLTTHCKIQQRCMRFPIAFTHPACSWMQKMVGQSKWRLSSVRWLGWRGRRACRYL
jgi:hypothetical protein